MTQTQKDRLTQLFRQALDVLSPDQAVQLALGSTGKPQEWPAASAMIERLLEKPGLPESTVRFIRGVQNHLELTGALSEKQQAALTGTYAAIFAPLSN